MDGDGQQVYVTGADGEQMVLSGPEAAALLEQAGINIHDGTQVLDGGDSSLLPEGGAAGEEAEGVVQIPEGSAIQEDGSILAADGSVLAPPGSVIQGEDGSLIMSQEASMLMQGLVGGDSAALGAGVAADGTVTDNRIYETPDGKLVTATGQLVNADGQLTGEVLGQVLETESQSTGTKAVEQKSGTTITPLSTNSSTTITTVTNPASSASDVSSLPVSVSVSTSSSEPIKIDNIKSDGQRVNNDSRVISMGRTTLTDNTKKPAPRTEPAVTSQQVMYTTASPSIVSAAPEGTIMTNADGNLVTADGRLLTNADGTPVSLADGQQLLAAVGAAAAGTGSADGVSILPTTDTDTTFTNQSIVSSKSQDALGSEVASLAAPDGGIMVSAAGGTIMTATDRDTAVLPPGLLASEDGVISAPEGSIITEDGSLVSADGIVLAPPGSILTEEQQKQQQQPQQPPQQQPQPQQAQQQQQQQLPSGNLIGLQLPDENGEVLYLDPNDPAAAILLQEAGITLGEGGVLKTADGQVLTNEDGTPITSSLKPPPSAAVATPTQQPPARNNLVGDAVAAAGLGAEELGGGFQLGGDSTAGGVTSSAASLGLPSVTGQSSNVQQTKYQKLTYSNNSPGLSSASAASGVSSASQLTSPRITQRKTVTQQQVQPQQRAVKRSSEVSIGPDQQKVTYTVTSENGYSQTYMMICSKSLDQNTLISTLIKNISNDPQHKGKKTIKITQHKYGAKKAKQQQQTPQQLQRQTPSTVSPTKTIYSRNYVQQQQSTPTSAPGVRQVVRNLGAVQQQQQLDTSTLSSTPGGSTLLPPEDAALSLEEFVEQLGDLANNGEVKVIVRCSYCSMFRSVLNSQTWENILNHILPVAREELHTAFYGNILKNFSRGLKIQVLGRTKEICEVNVSHGLVCRRSGAWYQVQKPKIELAIQLATHIAAVQPGVSGPYGARPRGNSLICLFCSSPYTAEDYQKHLSPHMGQIIPCLLLIAGAYCSNSFETEIKKLMQCGSCEEGEHQDLRFLPCSKFSTDYSCTKKLQATVDCFRENFDSRGFLQVSNSAMTKCSVCRNQSPTYCALFKLTNPLLVQMFGPNEMLAVCSNCQKQFVNIVMRENAFDKQLKMFQLHHMEQLCGVLRVLLSVSQKICTGLHNVLYTVQEGGSLYSASSTVHKVVAARLLHLGTTPPSRAGVILEENKNIDMSGPSIRFVCDQCKFSIDLTRLEHKQAKTETHLVEMALGVVLEHIVPHTDSLLSVLTTAAKNELLDLKFEFTATVEGEGSNRRINVSLDRKIVPAGSTAEISIQKDIFKTIEAIKGKITSDKKGNYRLFNRYVFLDQQPGPGTTDLAGNEATETNVEIGQFLDKAKSILTLYGSAGCNTKLLDYYSECKLCSKFSFPDFRLTAGMKSRQQQQQQQQQQAGINTSISKTSTSSVDTGTNNVALCENCCETILSLCVPSEPERLTGRGDSCLLLGVDKTSGHRLVLSNQAKKWISADGVEAIKTISDVAALSTIPEYSSTLIQKFRSYLMAVCSRTWSEPDCVTARAGFIVKPPEPNFNPPIEVKVTLRPPKTTIKTPSGGGVSSGRLQITPVPVSSRGRGSRGGGTSMTPTIARISSTGSAGRGSTTTPRGTTIHRGVGQVRSIPMNRSATSTSTTTTPGQKLVKITANRRIIPVRDPTSINTPVRGGEQTTSSTTSTPTSSRVLSSTSKYSQQKIEAMREALRASAKAAEAAALGPEEDTEDAPTSTPGVVLTTKSSPLQQTPPTGDKTSGSSTTVVTAEVGATGDTGTAGGDEDTDFETLEDIANFINSSEPVQEETESSKTAKEPETDNREEVFSDLQDEFTNNSLKLSTSQQPRKPDGSSPPKQIHHTTIETYKLPKGTVVANLTKTGEVSTTCTSEVAMPADLNTGSVTDTTPVRIPSTLRISQVKPGPGVTKLQVQGAVTTTQTKLSPIHVSSKEDASLPSPASDATTSTRSTAAPSSLSPASASRKLPATTPTSASSSQQPSRRGRPPNQKPVNETIQAAELSQEMESLTSLNLDLVDTLDLDLEELEGMGEQPLDTLEASPDKKAGSMMKLSKILQGRGAITTIPVHKKVVDLSAFKKRKREDEEAKSKKRQSYATPEAKGPYTCAVCEVKFKQEAAFIRHTQIHRGALPFNCGLCGRSFPDKMTFKQHAKTHMNGQETDEEGSEDQAETPDYMKGLSQSGRVRKAKKMFDL